MQRHPVLLTVSSSRQGPDPFIQSEIPGASEKGRRTNLIDIMQKLNKQHQSGISSFHSDLWSQNFIDSQALTEEYRLVLVSSAASVSDTFFHCEPWPGLTMLSTWFRMKSMPAPASQTQSSEESLT